MVRPNEPKVMLDSVSHSCKHEFSPHSWVLQRNLAFLDLVNSNIPRKSFPSNPCGAGFLSLVHATRQIPLACNNLPSELLQLTFTQIPPQEYFVKFKLNDPVTDE